MLRHYIGLLYSGTTEGMYDLITCLTRKTMSSHKDGRMERYRSQSVILCNRTNLRLQQNLGHILRTALTNDYGEYTKTTRSKDSSEVRGQTNTEKNENATKENTEEYCAWGHQE